MGKVIKHKIQGMSWWMKTSLVLLLTLTTMVFMYEGWYKPNQAAAAPKTYYITDNTGTAVATGITTNVASGTNPDSATPTPDINLLGTVSSSTATNRTVGSYSAGATMLESIYNTPYPSATTVTGTSYFGRLRDGTSGGYTVGFQLFYVAANGTRTNFTGAQATRAIGSGTSADYTVSLAGQSATVPAGSKLGIRVIFVSGTSTDARVYFGSTAAVSGGDGGVVTVDEVAGDTTKPTVTAFAVPATSSSLTISGITFTASDNVGVTGYLINESATPPAAAAITLGTAPTSYTAASAGTKTLYAWVEDAAGNVSNVFAGRTSTITLPDVTPPAVTAFTVPATSASLTISGITFTASDNVGVTGYLINESATPPAAAAITLGTAPTSYTAASAGTKTLYAWVEDAAGNVSNAFAGQPCTITLADAVKPTVTAFTVPATSSSLTISGITFTASDNVGVTGYLINESATPPAAAAITLGTAPTSYTAGSAGAKTLYAWVEDAAGNVSNVFTGRACTITLAPADILTVGTNFPIALAASDSSPGVVMQRLQLNSNVSGDGQVILSTVTLDDNAATATNYANALVYISPTSSATLPADKVLIGSQPSFSGASTPITLSGGTVADRTVTTANKFLYIVYDMASGQSAKTVQSRVTAVGVSSPDTVAAGFPYSSNSFTLTVGPVANIQNCNGCHGYTTTFADGTARNTPVGQFQGSHNQHVITSPTACSVCHTAPATTTSADFSHADGTVTMAATINGGTYVKGSFPAANSFTPSTCNATTCHGTSSTAWGTNTTQSTCTVCHGVNLTSQAAFTADPRTAAPGYNSTGQDTGGLAAATGAKVGAHDTHLRSINNYSSDITCDQCHTVPATVSAAGHIDSALPAEVPMNGSLARANSAVPVYTSGTSTCTATYCHFGKPNNVAYSPAVANAAVVWNNTAYLGGTTADCQKCHASPPSAAGVHAGKAFPASCNACHSHVSVAGAITDVTLHINGVVDATGGHAFPYSGSLHLVDAGTTPWSSCNGCHNTTLAGAYPVAAGTAPNCMACHVGGLKVASGTSSCWDCHGVSATNAKPNGNTFPNRSASHTGHTDVAKIALTCANCHNGFGAGTAAHGNSNRVAKTDANIAFTGLLSTPTWTVGTNTCSAACHIAAVWGAPLGCINCHAATVNTSAKTRALDATVTTRAAVVGEFTNTWSHKRSFTGTPKVVNADCIVCHMEGDKASGNTTSAHANGYVNLRDPDTGLNITNVTFGGAGAGVYTPGATPVQFVRFSRNLAVKLESDPQWLIVAAIQQNHCVKCHDANGATNANAQVPTTGLPLKPFGVTITNHAAPFNTNGSGNVVNVAGSFAIGNASYHPVIGKQNNSYVQGAQMVAPYNGIVKTNGNITSWGALISCWDCHATLAQTGTMTRTVTAHGNGVTLRGPVRAAGTTAATNLCVNCHATKYATVSTQHGAGSAFTVGKSNMGTSTFNNCSYCHSYGVQASTYTATQSRPLRAEDAHGFNDRVPGTVGSKWSGGNRPYAFIRNTLSNWSPKSGAEAITLPSTCAGTGGTCGNDMGGDPNGIGGVY